MSMSTRIILVGATGRVGALVLEDLVRAGHEVVACARGASKIPASQQVESMTLDLRDPLSQIADWLRWEQPQVKPAIDALADYYVTKNMADQYLIGSGLDYTIIEPGSLTEQTGTGAIQVEPDGPGPIPIADVAQCLADCVDLPQTTGRIYNIIAGGTPIRQALTTTR